MIRPDSLLGQLILGPQKVAEIEAPPERTAPQEQSVDPEQFLIQHHRNNLAKGGVPDKDGSIQTYRGFSVGIDGKTYMLPKVWDGQVLSEDEAIKRAEKLGLDKFPAYDSPEKAEKRYQELHEIMEDDLRKFRGHRSGFESLQGALLSGKFPTDISDQSRAKTIADGTSTNPRFEWAKEFFAEQDKKPFSAGARTLLKKAMEESDEALQLLQKLKTLGVSDAVPRRKTNSKDRPRLRLSPEDQLLLEFFGRQHLL